MVGISAITTRRSEFANLSIGCVLVKIDVKSGFHDIRKVDIFEDEINTITLELTYSDSRFARHRGS